MIFDGEEDYGRECQKHEDAEAEGSGWAAEAQGCQEGHVEVIPGGLQVNPRLSGVASTFLISEPDPDPGD